MISYYILLKGTRSQTVLIKSEELNTPIYSTDLWKIQNFGVSKILFFLTETFFNNNAFIWPKNVLVSQE